MKGAALDYTNILLMLVSAMLAFFLPFWLFLFAYAVLGPLHYLTEIPWLHRKNYFTKQKSDHRFLVAGTLLLFVVSFTYSMLEAYSLIIMFLFIFSLIMNTVSDRTRRIWLLFFVALGLLVAKDFPLIIIMGILLPTIIHVFIFTGCFLLYGALRNKSVSGLVSVGVFVLCPIALVWFSLHTPAPVVSLAVQKIYSVFEMLNLTLLKLLNVSLVDAEYAVYASLWGIAIMKFIAYAYTYHYLNWFSKTKIIEWHLLPKKQWLLVLLLWILAVGVYAYDYRIGVFVLYFLSLLHVILEFPLNNQTFIGIYGELKSRITHA